MSIRKGNQWRADRDLQAPVLGPIRFTLRMLEDQECCRSCISLTKECINESMAKGVKDRIPLFTHVGGQKIAGMLVDFEPDKGIATFEGYEGFADLLRDLDANGLSRPAYGFSGSVDKDGQFLGIDSLGISLPAKASRFPEAEQEGMQ